MYIRTKDKIYKVFESPLNDDEDFVYVAPNGCISETDILNQSENLEELCDEFVITCVEDYEYKHFYPKIADINDASEYATEDVYTVYGAIWTSKGLIYVAKMNDKGELELI